MKIKKTLGQIAYEARFKYDAHAATWAQLDFDDEATARGYERAAKAVRRAVLREAGRNARSLENQP